VRSPSRPKDGTSTPERCTGGNDNSGEYECRGLRTNIQNSCMPMSAPGTLIGGRESSAAGYQDALDEAPRQKMGPRTSL
jgi:hypothetical protein